MSNYTVGSNSIPRIGAILGSRPTGYRYRGSKYNERMSEMEKREFVWNEFKKLEEALENKIERTRCKASMLKIFADVTSILIIILGLLISFLEAISATINVKVLVLGTIVSAVQAIYKYFKWTPRSAMFKSASIQTRKLSRSLRNIKYFFGELPVDEILPAIDSIQAQLDDIETDNVNNISLRTIVGNNRDNENEGPNNDTLSPNSRRTSPVNVNHYQDLRNIVHRGKASIADTDVLNDFKERSQHESDKGKTEEDTDSHSIDIVRKNSEEMV